MVKWDWRRGGWCSVSRKWCRCAWPFLCRSS